MSHNPTIILTPAHPTDADRLAEIHMSAFATNAMLHAQFPSSHLRTQLRLAIREKAIRDMQDAKTALWVVRTTEGEGAGGRETKGEEGAGGRETKGQPLGNEVISYARWILPLSQKEEEEWVEPPWRLPEGTEWGVLNRWTEVVEGAKERTLKGGKCYRLLFIATDPRHERRGAASLLINWGLKESKRNNIPVYLESTLNALPLYLRLGFTITERISMVLFSGDHSDGDGDGDRDRDDGGVRDSKDGDDEEEEEEEEERRESREEIEEGNTDSEEKEQKKKGKKGKENIYEEICLIFRPSTSALTQTPPLSPNVAVAAAAAAAAVG